MSVKHSLIRLLAVTASAWAIGGAAMVGNIHQPASELLARLPVMSAEERKSLHQEWQTLSPEQQAEKKREMREHLAAMTPEQRQQMRQQMREHWQQMPQEQRYEQRQQWQDERRKVREDRGQQRGGDWAPPPGGRGEGRGGGMPR